MSTRSDLHDLIQLEIDGAADPEQKAALAAWLATDEAARDEMEALKSLSAMLSRVPPVDAPGDLVDNVMRTVRASRTAPPTGFRARLRAIWPETRSILPYAYAAAAGAAACLLVVQIAGGGSPFGRVIPVSDAAGTMGTESAASRRFPLHAGDEAGSAVVTPIERHFALVVDLPSVEPSQISLSFDPAAVRVLGLSAPSGGLDQALVSGGSVHWTQAPGHRTAVLFAPITSRDARVDVAVARGGVERPAGTAVLPGRGDNSEN